MRTIIFSLIMATYGRKNEIDDFLESLCEQTYNLDKIEVIIIDQNDEIILDDIVKSYENKINIKHVKSERKGLSYNRNIGLGIAKGAFVAFPDDDCTYYEDTLQSVFEYFALDKNVDAILGQIVDRTTKKKIIRNWPDKEIVVNSKNFFMLYSSITVFTKKSNLLFDENFGVGEKYGSYEDADYIIGLIKNGKVIYTPSFQVWHPELNLEVMSTQKVKKYSMGFGALCRKHFSLNMLILFFKAIGFHLFKLLTSLLLLNREEFSKRYYSITYRIKGYIEYKHNNSNI